MEIIQKVEKTFENGKKTKNNHCVYNDWILQMAFLLNSIT